MIMERVDGVFEIKCTRCDLKLTECIESPMPVTKFEAIGKALAIGWVISPFTEICYGCSNVQ